MSDALGLHRDTKPKDHPLWDYFVVWHRVRYADAPVAIADSPYHHAWDAFIAGADAMRAHLKTEVKCTDATPPTPN